MLSNAKLIFYLFLSFKVNQIIYGDENLLNDVGNPSLSATQSAKIERTKLTIAIMLPQDYIRLRNFNVCINKEMNRINKGNWSFNKHFYLDR